MKYFYVIQDHSNGNGIDAKTIKDLIVEYFPDYAASETSNDETVWIKNTLKNLKTQLNNNSTSNSLKSSTATSNNFLGIEKNNGTSTPNGDTNSTASLSNDNGEMLILQNAQLKTTVEEYKNIIAETVIA